jgi:hypothetical protein
MKMAGHVDLLCLPSEIKKKLPPVGGNGRVNLNFYLMIYILITKLAGCHGRLQVLLQMPVITGAPQMTSLYVSPRLHFVQNYLEHVRFDLLRWSSKPASILAR